VKKLARQEPIYLVYLCSLADLFSKGSDLLLHFYRVMKLYPLVWMVNTNRKLSEDNQRKLESGPKTVW
jgi:hypothetical protein